MLISYIAAVFIYAQLAHGSSINPQSSLENRLQPRDTQNLDLLSASVLHKRANQDQMQHPDMIGGVGSDGGWSSGGWKPNRRSINTNIVTGDDGSHQGWGRYRVKRGIKTEMISGDGDGPGWRRDRVKRDYKLDIISGSDEPRGWRRLRVKRAIKTKNVGGSAQ